MTSPQSNNTIAELAGLLANRIRWEMEHSVEGYDRSIRQMGKASAQHESSPPPNKAPILSSTPFRAPKAAPGNEQSGIGTANRVTPSTAEHSDVEPLKREAAPSTGQGVVGVDKHAALEALRNAIGECTRCVLHAGRTHLVFGEGSPEARLVFVGEGPGRDEDLAGRPFVGSAGQLLDKIIAAMGLSREKVYICNVVKCRPPGNRTPEPTERRICGPFVHRQLAVIRPEVVVALGATAAAYLLDTESPISRLRGRFHMKDNLKIMPTFHPAFLLRNPGAKRDVWNDMQQVMAALGLQKENG